MRILLTVILLFCWLPAHAATVIDAQVVRNQTGSGSTFISSGFPLPEGLVTETMVQNGVIKVAVESTEIAANVSALRGRHDDGSVRSILIQFTVASMAQYDVKTATVTVDGGVRSYDDPAYVRPTYTHVENNNVILPTSNTYLVSTMLAFRNLLVEGGGSAAEEKLFTTLAENRSAALSSVHSIVSDYNNGSGLIALWCRTGDKTHWNRAVQYTIDILPYNTPTLCNDDGASWINPDGRTGTNASCGKPTEALFPRLMTYAQMYLMTGYRDFWTLVAYFTQFTMGDVSDQTSAETTIIQANDSWDQPRFQYYWGYGGLYAAHMIDATAPATDDWATKTMNYANNFDWIIDAMVVHEWNLGDYMDGLVGTRDDSLRTGADGKLAMFQHIFPLNQLIDQYFYVHADSRIPGIVKTNLDILLQNFRLLQSGDAHYGMTSATWGDPYYGHPYWITNPISSDASAYYLPMYARIIAFVLKTSGEATVNGANYTTWYDRVINTGNVAPDGVLGWAWKHYGQFYGWGMDAPWIMAQSSLSGPSSVTPPTQYNSIPGDTPDVYRTAAAARKFSGGSFMGGIRH